MSPSQMHAVGLCGGYLEPVFTGIIEEIGTVAAVQTDGGAARLEVVGPLVSSDAKVGESICVSGVCLTIAALDGEQLTFDAIPETLLRSNLSELHSGSRVHLERAVAAGARMGGHIVQGHVDGTVTMGSLHTVDNAVVLALEAPANLMRYIVSKGSVAIDGVSLTVVDVESHSFTVWLVPHTVSATTLGARKVGDRLNLETDIVARYLEKLAGLSHSESAAFAFEKIELDMSVAERLGL